MCIRDSAKGALAHLSGRRLHPLPVLYECQRNEDVDDEAAAAQDRHRRRVQLRAPGSFEREELPTGIEGVGLRH